MINKASQEISLTAIPTKVYGDGPFAPIASSSAGLAISFTTSDGNIAEVVNDKIVVKKPGEVTIYASQPGNDYYKPAVTQSTFLKINKAQQVITLQNMSDRTYGEPSFTPVVSSSSGLFVSLQSSDNNIAEIVEGKILIKKPGVVSITAHQQGNEYYHAATASTTLNVKKANQTISFSPFVDKVYGDLSFDVTATSSAILPVRLTSSNPAIASISDGKIIIKGAGEAVISATQEGNTFYNAASPVAHVLKIKKASQSIVFPEISEKEVTDKKFTLTANATSQLSIKFLSDNTSIATIEGNEVVIHSAGVVNIVAAQEGNDNYNAAEPVARKLVINTVTSLEAGLSELVVYPNPAKDYLFVNTTGPIDRIELLNVAGVLTGRLTVIDNAINIRDIIPGVYFLRITCRNKIISQRFVKQ